MRFVPVLIVLAGCQHDLDSVDLPCSHEMKCDNGLMCGDDNRCIALSTCPQMLVQQGGGAGSAQEIMATFPSTTTPGSVLLVVAMIKTNNQLFSGVGDGVHVWRRAAGAASLGSETALDIWFTTATSQTTTVTALFPPTLPKETLIHVSEWTCADGTSATALDQAVSRDNPNALAPRTGSITTTKRDLIVGALSHTPDTLTAFVPADGFQALPPFGLGDLRGQIAYAWMPPGTYDLGWTFSAPRVSVGAIIAIDAR